ncbi:MAG: transcriptional regulator [Pyrinomonadaceae bacterium]
MSRDPQEEILLCGDAKTVINSRAFQVLLLLVERAGKAVSKQEFFDTVWADTFVQDNSLTVAITSLRKALGDDAKNPKFIENVPRKGYRFIAEVTRVAEPANGPLAFDAQPPRT